MLPGVIVGLIFAVLLAAFGLYRLYQYYNYYRHIYSKNAWPEIAGTVVDGFSGYTPGVRGSKVYYALIQYHYLASGNKYMGELKKHVLGGKLGAKRLLAKYPPDSTIQVHYNPAQPKDHVSALEKSWTYLAGSLALFIFGFLGIIAAFVAR